MIGYKALNKDMEAICGDEMTYELNKVYVIDNNIYVGRNGYHLCKTIIDIETYSSYTVNYSRVFLVDTLDGDVINKDGLYCSNKIKLIREVTKEELDKYFLDNLEEFTNSKDWKERAYVAKHGYNLDKLIKDKNLIVRTAVVEQDYRLDILLNDVSPIVRAAVAEQGYGLDKLINDKDWRVRMAVAEQGYGLDILSTDEDIDVRTSVYDMILRGGYKL